MPVRVDADPVAADEVVEADVGVVVPLKLVLDVIVLPDTPLELVIGFGVAADEFPFPTTPTPYAFVEAPSSAQINPDITCWI